MDTKVIKKYIASEILNRSKERKYITTKKSMGLLWNLVFKHTYCIKENQMNIETVIKPKERREKGGKRRAKAKKNRENIS